MQKLRDFKWKNPLPKRHQNDGDKAEKERRRTRNAAQLLYNKAVRGSGSQTGPETPKAKPFYEEQLEGGGSNTTELLGSNLSRPFQDDPPQGQPPFPSTQSPRGRAKQEQGSKANELSSNIPEDTRELEPGRSPPISIMDRPRGDMGIGVVETEEDRGFGAKQGDGSTDLNKSLPLRPGDSDLEDENSLHSQYNGLEDSHTPLHGAKFHRLERRPVGIKQRRGSKQSNESTPAVRTNHREAEAATLLDTQELERGTVQMPLPDTETNATGNHQVRAPVMRVSPELNKIDSPLQENQHEEEPDAHDFSQAVAYSLVRIAPLPQEMETQESDDVDPVAELERVQQSPGNRSSRSSIDSDDSTKATVGTCHPQANKSNGSRRAQESSPDAVERFYHHLNKVEIGDESEMFQQAMSAPRSLANAEAALQSLIQAYDSVSLRANHLNGTVSRSEDEYKSLKTSYGELGQQIKDLIDEASKVEIEHGKEISRLEGSISTMQLHIDNLERRYDERVELLGRRHQSEKDSLVGNYQARIKHLEDDLAASQEERTRAISELEEQHQLERKRLKEDLMVLKQEHARQISGLEEQYQKYLNTSAASASNQLATMKRNLEGKLNQEQKDHLATKKKYKVKMEEMTKQHEEEKAQAATNFAAKQAELEENLRKREKQLEKEHRDKKLQYDEALRIARERHQRQLDTVNSELGQAEENKAQEIIGIMRQHAGKMRFANETFQNQLASVQGKLEKEINEKAQEIQAIRVEQAEAMQLVQDEARSSLEDMRSQLKRMKEAKVTEIRDLKDQHASNMQRAQENFQRELGGMRAQLQQLSMTKDEEIKTIRLEYEAERVAMKEAHDVELVESDRGKQETIDILQGALVKRDHFKAISDREVASRFHKISSDLDDFSRVQWEKFRESNWPFSEQSLRLTANGNERRAKQHLMQNTLWVILYEKVFCTPFRVLGSEGKSLERQWIEKFGEGALCPRPTKESETWRYENMMTPVEATSQPLMEGEPKYNIKQGYESTLDHVTNELLKELETVARINDRQKQRMRNLVEKAAKLWLDVGQQRCRMFLKMSESGEKPVRSRPEALKRDGSLNLVVMPELRRYGNAQGERLENDPELVMGCKGEFSVFHAR